MFKNKLWKNFVKTDDFQKVAKSQLDKNRAVFESLRDYDQGKKDISTADISRRLRDLQTTS